MKSYLSLIPISARVHRRQNRMMILCILIAVLLVTTIFSCTDMVLRSEAASLQAKHGNWHLQIETLSQSAAEEIAARPDVAAAGWSASFNQDADQPYTVNGRKAALYGVDETYLAQLAGGMEQGAFPQNDREVVLSSNAGLALDVQPGDTVTLQTPAGSTEFTVSGFGSDDREYYEGQTYLVAVYMTPGAFAEMMDENGVSDYTSAFYVQFESAAAASGAIGELQAQYSLPEGSIQENKAVMGLAGQSSSEAIQNYYAIAAVLFVLVLLAGVLMISGSMNSQVAQRTRFFGMLRCIGASRRQIIRFVRLEALNWCRTAIPLGLVLGTAITWGLCAVVRYGIGGEFAGLPVFALSPTGLVSGAVVGLVTVLLAAQSPARRAARVSPMAAVTSGSVTGTAARRLPRMPGRRVELALGVRHATASRKNWLLMTASFSLSIILFLCFSVLLDFAGALLPSMRSWQPDLTLNGYANALLLEPELLEQIRAIPHVRAAFGTAYLENVPAVSSREGVSHVNLIAYTDDLLDSAADTLVEGEFSGVYGSSGQAVTVHNKDNPLRVGDTVQVNGHDITITGAVSECLFSSEYSVLCSPETFALLTGESNYSLIGIQLDDGATQDTLRQINALAGSDIIFDDLREGNRQDAATYLAAQFVLYSFLAILGMITLFHIVNSISMSVTARIRQYGAMRAVGMDGRQLARMIAAEALTYALSGLVVGCAAGLALSCALHHALLTRYFGIAWTFPALRLCIAVAFGLGAACLAAHAPAKRIRNLSITETINEL